MSNQDGTQAKAVKHPVKDDRDAWERYWIMEGQAWRIEPEIDTERQAYLDEKRRIEPNLVLGIYPFKDVELNRADLEWLLATHENGRGPIDWRDKGQHNRRGLDLQGADLRGADLDKLPLANTDLREAHLEKASLVETDLENAFFEYAHLEGAWLGGSIMYSACLEGAHLEGAILEDALLGGASFSGAHLNSETALNDTVLSDKEYGAVSLVDIHWNDANLGVVDWSIIAVLGDEQTAQIPTTELYSGETHKPAHQVLREHQTAAQSYRQLSVVLRNQGLSEDANRFAYRAQFMQREVFRLQGKREKYIGSLFLYLLTGYGYKPMRSIMAYLVVIATFALAYFIVGQRVGPVLSPLGSLVFSVTSFHGRGFFPGGIKLDDPLTVLAAAEAIIGLLIEVTFIATLTRRLFGQ